MKNLLLIDSNALIHRSFHALPPFTNKEGQPSGALYGLASILIKILKSQNGESAPTNLFSAPPSNSSNFYVAAFFDRPEPTFRKKIYDEYKIHRPPTPDELKSQIAEARNLFAAFGVKTFEAPGFEADDLIGSAVEKFKREPDLKIIILTGDADALQLVENDKIVVETFKKGVSETMIYNEKAVKERYGISPAQLPDYKGLVGDASDNIKGVSGIGPKTAIEILQKYATIENFLAKGNEEKNYQKILEQKESALLSKNLATIQRAAPLEIKNLEELKYDGWSEKNLTAYFEKFGFKSLTKRLASL